MTEEQPSEPQETRTPRKPIRLALAALGVLVLAVAVVLAITLWPSDDETNSDETNSGGTDTRGTSTSTNPTTTPGRDPLTRQEAIRGAEKALERFLDTKDKVLQAADGRMRDADSVAQGPVKGELAATMREFMDNGYHQRGAIRIAGRRPVHVAPNETPPAVTLRVCLDSTEMATVDSANEPVGPPAPEAQQRVPHLYTVQLAGQAWKVTEHSFPRSSTC